MAKITVSFVMATCWCLVNEISSESREMGNLIGKLAPADHSVTCPAARINELDPTWDYFQNSKTRKARRASQDTAGKRSSSMIRSSQMDAEERRERINESMARLMQLLTFFGHVDNYLTQKASNLMKIMGRAVESEEEDVRYPYSRGEYYKSARRYRAQPKISTTITS